MMKIQGTDIVVEQTDSYCMECDIYERGDGVNECPNDPDHPVEPVAISQKPLLPDGNKEHFHHGFKQYVYMLVG